MDLILHIWNKIVSTNTFNFIVMAVLLYWIFKKVDIMKLLENSRQKVIDSIETSKAEKALAHKKLADANEQVKNLDKEVAARDGRASRAHTRLVVAALSVHVGSAVGTLCMSRHLNLHGV